MLVGIIELFQQNIKLKLNFYKKFEHFQTQSAAA